MHIYLYDDGSLVPQTSTVFQPHKQPFVIEEGSFRYVYRWETKELSLPEVNDLNQRSMLDVEKNKNPNYPARLSQSPLSSAPPLPFGNRRRRKPSYHENSRLLGGLHRRQEPTVKEGLADSRAPSFQKSGCFFSKNSPPKPLPTPDEEEIEKNLNDPELLDWFMKYTQQS